MCNSSNIMSSSCDKVFGKLWPLSSPTFSDFSLTLLNKCKNIQKPPEIKLKKIIENSDTFPIQFPIETCRIKDQPQNRAVIIEQQVNSAYPIIHERVLWLYLRFLEHKLKYGNQIEKDVYSKLNLSTFVQRLLTKRCISFFGKNDKFLLKSGESGISGFVPIGTPHEKAPLLLKDCLSYDEIKLGALLYVSSHSEFLNNGNRQNVGVIEQNKTLIERSGVIIGIIGARLSRCGLMEFQDIIINKSQNTTANGYGSKEVEPNIPEEMMAKLDYRKIWNEFYDEQDFLYTCVNKDGQRFGYSRNKDDIFDNLLMKKRYTIPFDVLLLESESRAAAASKKAYIHVIGIGLGVWKTSDAQDSIFLETFSQRIKALLPQLKHVAFIHFSWFKYNEWKDLKNGSFFENSENINGGIRILISKRNPADKLLPECEDCLTIQSYAWDGNALPGNEFWMKMLKSTGDSAAACSTLITEIHNPHINIDKVSGDNLHVASEKYGVIHISEFSSKILSTT